MQTNSLALIIVVVAIGGAWTERETIKKYWQTQFQQSSEKSSQTTVYTWKDSEGTVHYSKNADDKQAKETIIDTRKISRLEPLPVAKKAEKEKNQSFVMDIRDENERTRKIMQAAKDKQMMGE
mgnify:CR=1 FL=1